MVQKPAKGIFFDGICGVCRFFSNFAVNRQAMTTLEKLINIYGSELEGFNGRISRRLDSPNELMSTIVKSQLQARGKQLRPLLLIMCARMFGPADDKVLASAAAVELIHNASLIHDDVVDNSMTRRSRPTINAVWDNHIAVLVGDFFTSSSMQEAILTGDLRIIDSLSSLGRMLSLGEIDQIFRARQHSIDEESYYKVVDYKTASLFVASAQMGCYAAGVSGEYFDILTNYAHLFGRCFQLRDDVFDYFDSERIGKPTGNDLREGKISLPLIKALEKVPKEVRRHWSALAVKENLTEDEIASLQQFARDNGGIEATFEVMEKLKADACRDLHKLPSEQGCALLEELFDFIIKRDF